MEGECYWELMNEHEGEMNGCDVYRWWRNGGKLLLPLHNNNNYNCYH